MIILLLSLAAAAVFAGAALYAWLRWQRLARDLRALTVQLEGLAGQDADKRGSVLVKSRERAARELAAAANHLLARDAETLRAKTRQAAELEGLMKVLSGDLRTPASALADHVESLQQQAQATALPETLRRSIEIAQAHAGTLTAKVDRFADLAAIKSGSIVLAPAATDLAALAEETLAAFEERLAAASVYVECDLAAAPPRFDVDPDAVRRILSVLLDNAITYGAAGGYLRLAIAETADGVSLTVEDHGPGLDETQRSQIFEGGTGSLGLAFAHALAEAMGASLTCDSLPHLCTMFTLWLKRAEKEEAVA